MTLAFDIDHDRNPRINDDATHLSTMSWNYTPSAPLLLLQVTGLAPLLELIFAFTRGAIRGAIQGAKG
jgi:hypothetical protein